MKTSSIKDSVFEFIKNKESYYKQWIFDEPIVVSKPHNDDLKTLQQSMFKLIYQFVTNYQEYKHLMPVSAEIEKIINIFNQKDYKIGTYRTDFVYDNQQQVKLIEITCRFALNGMFLSALMNNIATDYRAKNWPNLEIEDHYSAIYKHFETYLEDVTSIAILKGKDTKNESKIYINIFKRMGYPVIEIEYDQIKNNISTLKNAWIISELAFDEITSLGIPLITQLMPLNIINDFRTIFLIHDKRFFSVLGNKALQESVLSATEIAHFKRFYIPTYTSLERKDLWENAKTDKNRWIIKHRSLGKSEKVYAGIVTDQNLWDSLFSSSDYKDLILQKWIEQKTIKGQIDSQELNDYVTGTLLFFDDNYFGFGDFRTSSFPVTNKGDHRKATSLILKNNSSFDFTKITNYIN